jgi:hypothetical protein
VGFFPPRYMASPPLLTTTKSIQFINKPVFLFWFFPCFCFAFISKVATTKNRHFIYDQSMLCLSLAVNQRSAFLAHFGSFGSFFLWYGSFLRSDSRRWFLNYETNWWNHRNQSILLIFNQTIHEIWLFIILFLLFGSFRADPCCKFFKAFKEFL